MKTYRESLRLFSGGHEVRTVTELGWGGKTNGELLALLDSNESLTKTSSLNNLCGVSTSLSSYFERPITASKR